MGENPEDWKFQGLHTHFAVGAAKKAMADSGVQQGPLDPTRLGVYTGAGEGQQDFNRFAEMMVAGLSGGATLDLGRFTKAGVERLHPIAELEQEPNMPAAHLASLFDAQGPNVNCLTACAASSQAIGEAVEIIRRNEADVMLAGGAHTMIHPFGVTGFNLLTALSTRNDEPTRASRPFDRDRDGFVLGEGAGMIVLEDLDRARARARASTAKSSATARPPTPSASPTPIPRAAAPLAASNWPWPTAASASTRSTTSTPTAPAPRSTTRSKRWPSSRSSVRGRTRFPFPARRA